jgi:hypothetical protein
MTPPATDLMRRNKPVAAETWLGTTHDRRAGRQRRRQFRVPGDAPAGKNVTPNVAKTIAELHGLDLVGDALRYSAGSKADGQQLPPAPRCGRKPSGAGRAGERPTVTRGVPQRVSATATLGKAHTALGKAMEANDVFVTDTRQKSGVVLGWLTQSDLARTARACTPEPSKALRAADY